MARLTKLERDALLYAALEVQAGEPQVYFCHGCDYSDATDPEQVRAWRHAGKLAAALASAVPKLAR